MVFAQPFFIQTLATPTRRAPTRRTQLYITLRCIAFGYGEFTNTRNSQVSANKVKQLILTVIAGKL
jgi:hypothetical protein